MSLTPLPHANKTLYTTASPYEARIGYHRALRRGPHILVSGTTAVSPATQTLQAPGDAYGQTVAAFAEALAAVAALGGAKADVLRVRMYVGRREDCEAVGRGFREVFGQQQGQGQKGEEEEEGVGCVATMVVLGAEGGGGFIDPEMLVEVEIDAFVL